MNRFWVPGGNGNWNSPTNWSATSGGASGASVPTLLDNAFFDVNSFTSGGQIVNIPSSSGAECHDMDWTGALNNPTLNFVSTGGTSNIDIYGSVTLISAMSITSGGTSNGLSFVGGGTEIVTTAGVTINVDFLVRTFAGGNYTLQDDLTMGDFTVVVIFGNQSFDTNGKTVNIHKGGVFQCFDSASLTLGASVINLFTDGSSDVSFELDSGITFSPGTSKIVFDNSGSGYWSLINESGTDLFDVEATGQGFFDANDYTFNSVTINPGSNVYFPSFFTLTTDILNADGDIGNHIFFQSDSPGDQFTLFANTTSLSYIDVSDSVADGSIPFADAGGIDNGNNLNWTFPPAVALPFIINIDGITFDSASVQGDLLQETIDFFDQYGVVWDDNPNPTIPGGKPFIVLFGILGPFFVNLSNLVPGQTYYLRTFALKDGNYSYGATVIFTVPVQNPLTVISTDNLVSKYRFELLNQDGALLADLSGYIENREFTITRNRAEEISFSINLYVLDRLARDLHTTPLDLLKAGINTVRVSRAGQPLCAGQITYWEASLADDAVINVKALGWLNLLSYRVFSGTYDNEDQNFILRDLITQTQALTNGDFGITLGLQALGTNFYVQKIFENKSISDIFIEASEEEGGLDFEFTWDKKLNLFKPIGAYRQDILFTYPGNTKQIGISYDSSQIINSLLARGKGNADANINTIIEDLDSQVAYRLRTGVQDFPDMDADQLVNSASSEVAFYRNPIILRTVRYDGGNPACPSVGSFRVGDRCRVFVNELSALSAFNEFFMIDKMHVALGQNDEEDVDLSLSNTLTL